jgi:hypothetical protein
MHNAGKYSLALNICDLRIQLCCIFLHPIFMNYQIDPCAYFLCSSFPSQSILFSSLIFMFASCASFDLSYAFFLTYSAVCFLLIWSLDLSTNASYLSTHNLNCMHNTVTRGILRSLVGKSSKIDQTVNPRKMDLAPWLCVVSDTVEGLDAFILGPEYHGEAASGGACPKNLRVRS